MRWEGLTMFSKRSQRGTQYHGRPLGQAPGPIIFGGMCGRVRLSSDVSEIKLVFSIPPHRPTPNFPPSWNVAPTDPLSVVRYDVKAGERSLDVLRWGLVPRASMRLRTLVGRRGRSGDGPFR